MGGRGSTGGGRVGGGSNQARRGHIEPDKTIFSRAVNMRRDPALRDVPSKELGYMGDAISWYSQSGYSTIRRSQRDGLDPGNDKGAFAARNLEDFISKSSKWDSSHGPLYRGIRTSPESLAALQNAIQNGDEISMQGISSWSSSYAQARSFAGPNGVLLTLKSPTNKAASIKHLSAYSGEDEVLMSGSARFVGGNFRTEPHSSGSVANIYLMDVHEISD